MNTITLATAIATVLCILPSSMTAQNSRPDWFAKNKTEAILAVVDGPLPTADANAAVFRRAAKKPHDVILVSKDHLTAEWIAEAVWTLQTARAVSGLIPQTDATYRVAIREGSPNRRDLMEYAKDWARTLTENPQRRAVNGFGELPYLVVYLPNQLPKIKIVPEP